MIENIFLQANKIVPVKWRWVLKHEGFKRYFKNTGWMFFGQIFGLLVSFFVGAWLARYLGPDNYGKVNYVIAFVSMFGFVAHLGVHSILARDLVKYPEKKNELMGTSFSILLAGSILAFLLVVVSSFIFESSSFIRSLIIIYSSLFLWSPFGVIGVFFQSKVEARKNVRITTLSVLLAAVLKVILIVSGKGIIYLVLIFVFESLLAMVLSIFVYRKNGFRFSSWRFDFGLAKIILSGSGFLMFAAATNYIFARVDQVMIRHFLDEGSVGVYAAALKLVEVWYFIPGIVCASLLPAIINAKKISKEKYLNRLRGLFLFLGVTSFLIAVFLTISSSFIVKLLFGVEYLGSISVLNIYAWASIGMFLSVGFYQYFLAENKLKLLFFFYLFLMIVNIVLNLVLIPRIGINGAAWSTLFSYFLGLIIVLMMKK